jgi:hypothetical protein
VERDGVRQLLRHQAPEHRCGSAGLASRARKIAKWSITVVSWAGSPSLARWQMRRPSNRRSHRSEIWSSSSLVRRGVISNGRSRRASCSVMPTCSRRWISGEHLAAAFVAHRGLLHQRALPAAEEARDAGEERASQHASAWSRTAAGNRPSGARSTFGAAGRGQQHLELRHAFDVALRASRHEPQLHETAHRACDGSRLVIVDFRRLPQHSNIETRSKLHKDLTDLLQRP